MLKYQVVSTRIYEEGILMNLKNLNKYFDHTLLKPDATATEIEQLCREAVCYDFCAVCVSSSYVPLAARCLADTDIKIDAVTGFPSGACETSVKAFEAERAAENGASEIDMVIHIGRLKDGDTRYVKQDIEAVVSAAAEYGASVKVILETCLLTDDEIVTACRLSEEAGAAFVKTSTGFGGDGADVRHVGLMKKTVGDRLSVKASGGIRTLRDTLAMIDAGADRIGASASVSIMKEAEEKEADIC